MRADGAPLETARPRDSAHSSDTRVSAIARRVSARVTARSCGRTRACSATTLGRRLDLARGSAARLRDAGQEPPRAPARRFHRIWRPAHEGRGARAHLGARVRSAPAQRGAPERRGAARPGGRRAGRRAMPPVWQTPSSPTCSRSSGRRTSPRPTRRACSRQYLDAVEQLARAVDGWRA